MRQIQTTRPASANSRAPIATQNVLIPNMPETVTFVKEIETTVTTVRERVCVTIAPVCSACGEIKEHVVGAWFECINESCPTHDPDTGSAIPLPGEGENVIDVEPIKEAA